MKCFDKLIGVTQWGSLLENMASIIPPTPAGLGQGQATGLRAQETSGWVQSLLEGRIWHQKSGWRFWVQARV